MLAWSFFRRRKLVPLAEAQERQPSKLTHDASCLCALCGWTELLPTCPLTRPYVDRLQERA